jgi:hypothetical protein
MSQRTVVNVEPIDGGWAVKFEGAKSVLSTHTARSSAVKAASEVAQSLMPGEVKIHRADGTVEENLVFGEEATTP